MKIRCLRVDLRLVSSVFHGRNTGYNELEINPILPRSPISFLWQLLRRQNCVSDFVARSTHRVDLLSVASHLQLCDPVLTLNGENPS